MNPRRKLIFADEPVLVVEAPVVEAPVVEAPVVEAPIVEAPVVEAPVVEAPLVEPPLQDASEAVLSLLQLLAEAASLSSFL